MITLKNILVNEGIDFPAVDQHFKCFAHIKNLGAQDTLKLLKIKTRDTNKLVNFNNNEPMSDDDENDWDLNANVNKVTSVVTKVRNICKKIKNSEALTGDLKDFCTPVKIDFVKPILD